MKGLYFADIILMFLLAYFCNEWGGIWIAEGIFAGLGFFISGEIEKKEKNKKEGA